MIVTVFVTAGIFDSNRTALPRLVSPAGLFTF